MSVNKKQVVFLMRYAFWEANRRLGYEVARKEAERCRKSLIEIGVNKNIIDAIEKSEKPVYPCFKSLNGFLTEMNVSVMVN